MCVLCATQLSMKRRSKPFLRRRAATTRAFRVSRNGESQPLEFDASDMSDGTLRVLAALVAGQAQRDT